MSSFALTSSSILLHTLFYHDIIGAKAKELTKSPPDRIRKPGGIVFESWIR
jgi:hypothetical protein